MARLDAICDTDSFGVIAWAWRASSQIAVLSLGRELGNLVIATSNGPTVDFIASQSDIDVCRDQGALVDQIGSEDAAGWLLAVGRPLNSLLGEAATTRRRTNLWNKLVGKGCVLPETRSACKVSNVDNTRPV
jgi:hypothetical protein